MPAGALEPHNFYVSKFDNFNFSSQTFDSIGETKEQFSVCIYLTSRNRRVRKYPVSSTSLLNTFLLFHSGELVALRRTLDD